MSALDPKSIDNDHFQEACTMLGAYPLTDKRAYRTWPDGRSAIISHAKGVFKLVTKTSAGAHDETLAEQLAATLPEAATHRARRLYHEAVSAKDAAEAVMQDVLMAAGWTKHWVYPYEDASEERGVLLRGGITLPDTGLTSFLQNLKDEDCEWL